MASGDVADMKLWTGERLVLLVLPAAVGVVRRPGGVDATAAVTLVVVVVVGLRRTWPHWRHDGPASEDTMRRPGMNSTHPRHGDRSDDMVKAASLDASQLWPRLVQLPPKKVSTTL